MKMNWGTGIFITIVIFLIGMISLVIISSMQPLNLVTPDYYPKAIDYQSQMDRVQRTNALEDKMEIAQEGNDLKLMFPVIDSVNTLEGEVLIFFPRDNHLDKNYTIEVDSSLTQVISLDHVLRGRCVIKINWKQNDIEYYYEEDLMIN